MFREVEDDVLAVDRNNGDDDNDDDNDVPFGLVVKEEQLCARNSRNRYGSLPKQLRTIFLPKML